MSCYVGETTGGPIAMTREVKFPDTPQTDTDSRNSCDEWVEDKGERKIVSPCVAFCIVGGAFAFRDDVDFLGIVAIFRD
ncbi:hypothetical protein CEXT_29731 [Caerostris extrusa]|uniref:Uncharacterized protein n=1 Tax=Caerostris extrusa TaxID=172846 RepID=A0AAV4U5U6_CAEEX|nr:hypothetical protein CEXT_29731 [Caerostris extrusa]